MGDQNPRWIDEAAMSWTPAEPMADGRPRREPGFDPAPRPDVKPGPEPRFIAQGPPAPRPAILILPAEKQRSQFLLSLILGLLQGLALLWLFDARDAGAWPGNDPYLFTAITMALLFAPLLLIQGLGQISVAILIPWTMIAGGGLAALGFYHRWRVGGTDPGHAGLPLIVMAATFLFIMQSLLLAAARDGAFKPRYAAQYHAAWRLAVQIVFIALFAALAWVMVGAGYGWLRTHAPGVRPDVLTMPLVALAAAAAARMSGGLFAEEGARALAWIFRIVLPLVMLAALAEIIAVIAGLRVAELAPILALSGFLILCINASYGSGDVWRPQWRRKCEFAAVFLLLPLAIMGAMALASRIQQYGWTPERILAAAVLMGLAGYAIAYSGAALISLGGGNWMQRLEGANGAMAFAGLGLIAVLASPLADPVRLSVEAQSLRATQIAPAQFDFAWLNDEGLRFGHDALVRMSGASDPALARGAYLALVAAPARQAAPSEIGANIAVRTPGARLPESLLAQHWSGLGVPPCLTNVALSCDAYFLDMDQDGRDEIMLVYGDDTAWWGGVMKQDAGGWHLAGTMASPPCPGSLAALRAGNFSPVTPGWRDLLVAGQRLSLTGAGKPPVCMR